MLSKKIIYYIRYFVLKSNKIKLFNKIYFLFYKLSLIFIIWRFKKLRGIKAIYLEGSLTQGGARFKAGSTDIYLIIVTEELGCQNELEFIYAYIKKCIRLKKLFPFLKDFCALNKSAVCIHSSAKILGPYHFKTQNTPYKVMHGNADDYFIKKLNFSLESYPIDDFFILARTTLRPINEGLYNAATENWAYTRNAVINIERIINYINKNIPCFKSQNLTDELKKKIKFLTNKNFFAYSADFTFFVSLINDSYSLLEECLSHLMTTRQRPNAPVDKKISLTRHNLPNRNLTYIAEKMSNRITSIYKSEADILHNISIIPDYSCSYRYIPYIIFNNSLEPKVINNIYAALKEINTSLPQFSCCSNPVILTKKMFYLNKKHIETYHGPLDIFLCNKLILNIAGIALDNHLGQETINNFINTKLYGSISKVDYNYIIASHNTFEQLLEHLQNKNLLEVKITTDYLLGAITSHRLAVEKGIITSTPLETFTEYMGHYSNEELTDWYESFYHKFYDIKIPFSLQFAESQIKDLFYFYRKNREITNDIVNSNLKNNFGYYER